MWKYSSDWNMSMDLQPEPWYEISVKWDKVKCLLKRLSYLLLYGFICIVFAYAEMGLNYLNQKS